MTAMPTLGQGTEKREEKVRSDHTITVTATRQPVTIADAPVTVTVIDEKIADELATDIKDLVRYEPGVTVLAARRGSAPRSAPPAAPAMKASLSAASAAIVC